MEDHEFLTQISLFEGMSHDDLHVIADSVEKVVLEPGEILFNEGDDGNRAYFVKAGQLEILKEASGREVLLAVREKNAVIGEMALLQSEPRSATVRARSRTELYAIGKESFDSLLLSSTSAMQSVFEMMLERFKSDKISLQQSEKMAQLGTLTAGVAHELNNPAAAVKRNADTLFEAIHDLDQAYVKICQLNFEEHQWDVLNDLSEKANLSAKSPPVLDSLTRSDREEQIEDWLDLHEIEEPWMVAPNLVNLNLEQDDLAALAEQFPAEQLLCVIDWLNATYSVFSMLNELSIGSERIFTIVKSLKSYSYLDQAPVQSVVVTEGIDNTLTILHHKIKSADVNVVREYNPDLPEVMAYGSELNQVWTNIIDNAVDALNGTENPEITIRSRHESEWVVIEIEDNGPGIPEEIQSSIFDAFFTTKAPGKGTGLGLNITYNIVVQKHRGDIKVKSQPGKTVFEVWLPINFEE
jgi:signal transduction histidine kinase